jgi:hypothetical protein
MPLVMAWLASAVTAQTPRIVVERFPIGGGGPAVTQYFEPYPSQIDVTVGNTTDWVRVRADPTSQSVPKVRLFGDGNNVVRFVLGTSTFLFSGVPDGQHGASNWGGLETFRTTPDGPSKIDFIGRITGNLGGQVRTGRVWRLDVGGSVQSFVETIDPQARLVLICGSIASTGGVRATNAIGSDIDLVQSTGDIAGSIETVNGVIRTIRTTGSGRVRSNIYARGTDTGNLLGNIELIESLSTIGVPGSPASIRADRNIQTVTASAIYANIEAAASGGSFNVGRIVTTAAPPNGPFVGSLRANAIAFHSFEDGMRINGDLDADVILNTLWEPLVVTGRVPAGRRIDINSELDGFTSDAFGHRLGSITVNGPVEGKIRVHKLIGNVLLPGGLSGPMIVGHAGSTREWHPSATVRVGQGAGQITISAANRDSYMNLPPAFGGGLVGWTPFRQHANPAASDPGHNQIKTLVGSQTQPHIDIQFYGPIWIDGQPPVKIERRFRAGVELPDPPPAWETVSPSGYTASVVGAAQRTLRLTRTGTCGGSACTWEPSWEYRVSLGPQLPLVPGRVRCQEQLFSGLIDANLGPHQFVLLAGDQAGGNSGPPPPDR